MFYLYIVFEPLKFIDRKIRVLILWLTIKEIDFFRNITSTEILAAPQREGIRGGLKMPRSVISAETRSRGVASKAGL
jgi:hypothetical protein